MKSIISVLLLMSSAAYSQGVFNNEVNAALQKVIKDFPNQFNNIKGSAVPGNRQAVVFKSEVDFKFLHIACRCEKFEENGGGVFIFRRRLKLSIEYKGPFAIYFYNGILYLVIQFAEARFCIIKIARFKHNTFPA